MEAPAAETQRGVRSWMMPARRWTAKEEEEEEERRALLQQGIALPVNPRRHGNLTAWGKERGLFVRVDRAALWGNPFELGTDGDRETVIAAYRDHYLPFRPILLARLGELRGKALGCWCAPLACHADVLVAVAAVAEGAVTAHQL